MITPRLDRIYVAEGARDDNLVDCITRRYSDIPVTYLTEKGDPISELNLHGDVVRDDPASAFGEGKRSLLISRHMGKWMRSCPGTSHHVCCNLWTVDPGEGCPLDCTYCYLQTYLLKNPTLKLFSNTWDMQAEIRDKVLAEPNRLFRVCTGEVIDSLVWDNITCATLELVPFFASFENAVLELKTKTDNIENLLMIEPAHRTNTVISWSVNAASISKTEEFMTAPLDDRFQAAAKVAQAGYRVGFHFDPIVYFDGWEDEYSQTVRRIFECVDPNRIAWVSISTLRYHKSLQAVMLKRFPQSKLPIGEHFLAKDNKLRYIQPLRFKMLNFIWRQFKSLNDKVPVYMCMESGAAWRHIAGGAPSAGRELSEVFARKKLRLNVVS